MKKIFISILAVIALVAGAFISIKPIEANAATAKLNYEEITVEVGSRVKLKVKNTKKTVKWKSDNKAVAKVTKNGNVDGISAGECTVTAKVGKKTLTCKVVVTDSVLELLDKNVQINDVNIPICSKWEFSGIAKVSGQYQYNISKEDFKWICAQTADLTKGEIELLTKSKDDFMDACGYLAECFVAGAISDQITKEVIKTSSGYLGRIQTICETNGNDVTVVIYLRVVDDKLVIILGMGVGEVDSYMERIVKTICTVATKVTDEEEG